MQREDGTRAGHNEACRTRMNDCIAGTVEGRDRKAREEARVDSESARDKEKEDSKVLKEQEITAASEAIPDDVMAPVEGPSGIVAEEVVVGDVDVSDAESLKSRPSSHREVRVENGDQDMSDAESLKSGHVETHAQRTVEMDEEEQYWAFGGHHDDDMSSGNYLSEEELQSRPITPRDRSVRMEPRAPAVHRPAPGSNPASPTRPSKKAREQPDDLMSIVNSMRSIGETDKKIVASVLMGVSITEVFSPARVTEACKRFGMTPGDAYDIRSGFDLSDPKVQTQVEKKCATDEPDLPIACPPCTDFCLLQNLNIHVHGPEWEAHFLERKAKSIEHVKFCVRLFKQQIARGGYILFEHPSTASSWEEVAELKALLKVDGVEVQLADQCMYGLMTRGSSGNEAMSAKKTTRFLSNSWCILDELSTRCDKSHTHQQLIGGRAKQAGIYPDKLCDAICTGLLRQQQYDISGRTCSGNMSVSQLQSLLAVADTSQGETSVQIPFPEHWVDDKHERDGTAHMHIDTEDGQPRDNTSSVADRTFHGGVNTGAEALEKAMNDIYQESQYLCAVQESNYCTDDVSGAPLIEKLVVAARTLEMKFFTDMKVYDIVTKAESIKTGKGKVIKGRWIDTNKGDTESPDYRSRFVGKEFNTGVDATLYAATPPLEALKLLIVQAASMQKEECHIMFSDVKRAYFYAKARRELYVEVPPEDPGYFPGALGRLRLALYGTSDAASLWQECLAQHLESVGFTKGVSNPVFS